MATIKTKSTSRKKNATAKDANARIERLLRIGEIVERLLQDRSVRTEHCTAYLTEDIADSLPDVDLPLIEGRLLVAEIVRVNGRDAVIGLELGGDRLAPVLYKIARPAVPLTKGAMPAVA